MSHTGSRLSLDELIDLELQLQADRAVPLEQLAARDARIGREIGAGKLDGAPLLRGWLGAVKRAGVSVGQEVVRFLELVSAIAGIIGFLAGASLVWGWLAVESGRPVNVIHFWAVTVGVQLLLLALLVIAMLPHRWVRWLPGASSIRLVVSFLDSALPGVIGWVVARMSSRWRQTVEHHVAAAKKLDRLYGRLKLPLAVRLTQVFAVAFNLGAIVALVVVGYVTDPTFGWRSTLMTADQLHAAARLIATPWPWLVPTLDQVIATHDSSLDVRYGLTPGVRPFPLPGAEVWAAWYPFLLASLITYGLAARTLLFAVATLRIRLILRSVALDHVDILRLQDRLKPLETAGADETTAEPSVHAHVRPSMTKPASVWLLRWAGVPADAGVSGSAIRGTFIVGDVDRAGDHAALEAVGRSGDDDGVVLMVPAWEPPVGDHIDFLRELRRRFGDGRLITVIVHGSRGKPTAAQTAMWRHRLDTLADPWLAVEEAAP